VNKPTMTFSDTASYVPDQVLEIKGETNIPLKFVKFQRVDHLTIFVEENRDGAEKTIIQYIDLIGTSIEGVNMNELKKC